MDNNCSSLSSKLSFDEAATWERFVVPGVQYILVSTSRAVEPGPQTAQRRPLGGERKRRILREGLFELEARWAANMLSVQTPALTPTRFELMPDGELLTPSWTATRACF